MNMYAAKWCHMDRNMRGAQYSPNTNCPLHHIQRGNRVFNTLSTSCQCLYQLLVASNRHR